MKQAYRVHADGEIAISDMTHKISVFQHDVRNNKHRSAFIPRLLSPVLPTSRACQGLQSVQTNPRSQRKVNVHPVKLLRQILPWLSSLCFFLVLSACASLSEEECLYMHWDARGVMDGTKGEPANKINDYQNQCAKFSVQVDRKTYEAGRQQGLTRYCTRENGFAIGVHGKRYKNACTPALEPLFQQGYLPGHSMYSAFSNLRAAENIVSSSGYAIERLHERIDNEYNRLNESGLTESQERQIRNKIQRLRREILETQNQRQEAEFRLPDLRVQCRTVKQRVQALGFVVNESCY